MKRILMIVLACILVVSLYLNYTQYTQHTKEKEQIQTLKKDKKEAEHKQTTVQQENKTLTSQIDTYKKFNNNQNKDQSELDFNDVSQEFLTKMFTFEPDTYDQRKEEIKPLISEELFEQYFPEDAYGDSNSVYSKLNDTQIFYQAKQGENMQGLAVVGYESRSSDNNDWKKDTVLYQISFDPTTKQIQSLKNLGNSFEAENFF